MRVLSRLPGPARPDLLSIVAAGLLLSFHVAPVSGATLGMVADDVTDTVTVFDSETDTVVASVQLGVGQAVGDCAVTRDGSLGFVTNFSAEVWVIDLLASPPELAAGPNPIPISNPGEDVSLTPDQRFLVVCDGSLSVPVSVIDVASQTEIDTFDLGSDCNSVEVCSDGSVLVTSTNGNVRRLSIDDSGQLSDTGEVLLFVASPQNVVCAPTAETGVVVDFFGTIQSFTIPGLTSVDTRSLSGDGLAGRINPQGDRIYVRSTVAVDVFAYDSQSGSLGAAPLLSIPSSYADTFFGIDQLALDASGSKLYVPQPGEVRVYDASDGAVLTTITGPDIVEPTGVCLPSSGSPPLPPFALGRLVYLGLDASDASHSDQSQASILAGNAARWAGRSSDPGVAFVEGSGQFTSEVGVRLAEAGLADLTEIPAAGLAAADLTGFDVLYLGPTTDVAAYSAAAEKILAFGDAGGGLVVEPNAVDPESWSWVPLANLIGHSGGTNVGGETVLISTPDHPVMAGLTTGGLSNWGMSVHSTFSTPAAAGFEVLAVDQQQFGKAVIIAREAPAVIFTDGFESGDTSAWSVAVP